MSLRDRLRSTVTAAANRLGGRVLRAAAAPAPAAPAPSSPNMGTQAPPQRWSGTRRYTGSSRAKALTPATVAGYLQQADMGNPAAMAELLQEIEDRDLHILSVLGVRKRAVANLPWRVKPRSDQPIDLQIAEKAERAIRDMDNFEQGCLDLLDGIYKGYAATEIQWHVKGGLVLPRKLDYRPQQWLKPSQDDPESWCVLDDANPIYGVPLLPRKWIVHVVRSKSGFPVQGGLGRPIIWWYLFKNYAVKDWVSYSEKFGAPMRLGKFPAGATTEDQTELEEAVAQLGIDAYAIIPDDMKVELVGDGGGKTGGDTFERLLLYCDRQISKGVLGQTLTTEEGASGTQALGNVHNNVRADLRNADALELGRTLGRDLLGPWTAFNFGEQVQPPIFEFDVTPPADKKAEVDVQEVRGRVFAAARALGINISVAQVRDELGIREAAAGEAVLAPAGAPVATMAAAKVPGHVHTAACGAVANAAVGEASVTVSQLSDVLTAFKAQVKAAWRQIIRQLRAELGNEVDSDELRRRLPDVLRQVDMEPYADELARATLAAEALGRLQVLEGDPKKRPSLPTTDVLQDTEAWAKVQQLDLPTWAARVAHHRAKALDICRYAVLRQAQDILDQLVIGAPPAKSWDVAEEGNRQGQAVDQAGTQGWNDGRWDAIGKKEGRLYLRYHTMQDSRVRPAHAAMDGRVYPAAHPIWQVWRPPNGYGCRCWVTVHDFEEVQRAGWTITEDFATDEETGLPVVPDEGWRQAQGQAPKLDEFPPEWRAALGVTK